MGNIINLIATEIEFKKHSIVYRVKSHKDLSSLKGKSRIVVTHKSIANKDLILKTTYLDEDVLELAFVPINVTPQFYQKIFLETNSKLSKEYVLEKADIYSVGNIVGHLLS